MTSRQHTTRISAGSLRYRVIKQPGEGTRPVAQKVRQAIFNVLGDDLAGLTVLDIFAGSGALGFEALSRGAGPITFVEKSAVASGLIRENARELQVESDIEVAARPAEQFLQAGGKSFDLIFLDPPYDLMTPELIQQTAQRLAQDGTLVVSCGAKFALPETVGGHHLVRQKFYGETQIGYYK